MAMGIMKRILEGLQEENDLIGLAYGPEPDEMPLAKPKRPKSRPAKEGDRSFNETKPRHAPKGQEWVWQTAGGLLGGPFSPEREYWSPATYGRRGWWVLRKIEK